MKPPVPAPGASLCVWWLASCFGGPARGAGDPALEVAFGDHGDELVDGVFARRERSPAVAARGDAPLDGLAGVPVLAVGDVPEVAGVGGVEALRLDGLAGEEPLALDGGPIRGERLEPVGHHVVRVEAYEEVREELEVVDRAVLAVGEVGEVGGVALAVERHGLDALVEVHGAPDPGSFGLQVVAAAGRRADLAELGVDGGAVVALVVVLGQSLPVRRYLVVVAGSDDELLATVVPDQLLQVAGMLLERRGVAAGVREDPTVPLHDAHRDEGALGLVEPIGLSEARRASKLPVEPVGPGVVGTTEELAAGLAADRQELVPAVAADGVEGAQNTVLAAHEKDGLPAQRDGALVAGVLQAARAADADPAPVEEVLLLPPQHGPVGVRLGGEGAAVAERGQRRCEKLAGYGRHVVLPSVRARGPDGQLLLLECRNCTGKRHHVGA